MIALDIPEVAYKTWTITVRTGNEELDRQIEQNLKRDLSCYPYSSDHKHII